MLKNYWKKGIVFNFTSLYTPGSLGLLLPPGKELAFFLNLSDTGGSDAITRGAGGELLPAE